MEWKILGLHCPGMRNFDESWIQDKQILTLEHFWRHRILIDIIRWLRPNSWERSPIALSSRFASRWRPPNNNRYHVISHQWKVTVQLSSSLTSKFSSKSGGSPGLVVMGGDSCSKGRGFESLHHILDGHFFTLICCKICNDVCLKRPKIND